MRASLLLLALFGFSITTASPVPGLRRILGINRSEALSAQSTEPPTTVPDRSQINQHAADRMQSNERKYEQSITSAIAASRTDYKGPTYQAALTDAQRYALKALVYAEQLALNQETYAAKVDAWNQARKWSGRVQECQGLLACCSR